MSQDTKLAKDLETKGTQKRTPNRMPNRTLNEKLKGTHDRTLNRPAIMLAA